ncbi:MAG: hypothetical protein Q8M88_15110 [Phenylobacterium sp.]|uniref:hypothetical protein n=1 Tax=Phenylobacterium sp. TaxID=1871053 RepID=UPI002734FB4C|nr:hypothetical protein [Phenylobacterium sp.]MDP3175758.1 hypothetical protein [Phenylobacterium sp.]
MSTIILIVVVLVLLGLALYAIQRTPIPSPINWIVQVLLVVLAIWFIGTRAGVF